MTNWRSSITVSLAIVLLISTACGGIAKTPRQYEVSAEYEEEEQKTDNGVLGVRYAIAVDLTRKTHIIVMNVVKGGPAYTAGLMKGDRIIIVNDTPVATLKPKQVALHMRGDPGTKLKLTVKRGSDTLSLTLIRGSLTELPDREFQARMLRQAKNHEIDSVLNKLCEKEKNNYPDIVRVIQEEDYKSAASALEFVTNSNPKTNALLLYGLVLAKLGKLEEANQILQRVPPQIEDKQTRDLVRTLIADYSENKH